MPATDSNISLVVDDVVKSASEAVLNHMGVNVDTYLTMCLRQVAQDRQIPFTPSYDPQFWEDEKDVNQAVRYVESGAFSIAVSAYNDLFKAIQATSKACLEKAQRSVEEIADEEVHKDAERMSRLWSIQLKPYDPCNILDLVQSVDYYIDGLKRRANRYRDQMDVKSPDWVASAICDLYADALSEERPALFRSLEVLFEDHECLQALLPAAPSDILLEAKAVCLDKVCKRVVDTARLHPLRLKMRFYSEDGRRHFESLTASMKDNVAYRKLQPLA